MRRVMSVDTETKEDYEREKEQQKKREEQKEQSYLSFINDFPLIIEILRKLRRDDLLFKIFRIMMEFTNAPLKSSKWFNFIKQNYNSKPQTAVYFCLLGSESVDGQKKILKQCIDKAVLPKTSNPQLWTETEMTDARANYIMDLFNSSLKKKRSLHYLHAFIHDKIFNHYQSFFDGFTSYNFPYAEKKPEKFLALLENLSDEEISMLCWMVVKNQKVCSNLKKMKK